MGRSQEFAAVVGIDWSDQHHDVCLKESTASSAQHSVMQHSPEEIQRWLSSLRTRFAGRKVAVCLEQSRGPLINALAGADILVLYPVNPRALVNYRRAFATSHAKDDPTDAYLLMDLCLKHRQQLVAWEPEDQLTRQVRILSEDRRAAVNQRTELSNRLTAVLKQYFPVALQLTGATLHSGLSCELLQRWPCLQALQAEDTDVVAAVFRSHRLRDQHVRARLSTIATALGLTQDEVIIETSAMKVRMIVAQLRQLSEAIKEYDTKLRQLVGQHPEGELFASFPGAGAALRPRLVAAFGSDRQRFQSAAQVQTYSGIAPVTERSGKQLWVHVRWACPKFLRQTFHEYAGQSIRFSTWAADYYRQQRTRGKAHHAAVRALAFKWIRIMYRCWKDRRPYDESYYQSRLRQSDAGLLATGALT